MTALTASLSLLAALPLIPYPKSCVEKPGFYNCTTNEIAGVPVTRLSDASIAPEGYRLSVTPEKITIWSSDAAGAFYAVQTLRQLAQEKPAGKRDANLKIPCVEIDDAPEFKWRGLMLDEVRHFMGKEVAKKQIDLISRVKMNVFHWHLTDDEGWRLEIKRHPEIHLKGSVRPESYNHGADEFNPEWNNERYGPFYYTHEDVKEVLAYAAERHVTVVPEFDFPAHSRAFFVSHPEVTCIGPDKRFAHPITYIGPQYECFCAANEDGMKLIEDVLEEICELFPSKFIHIGGDECPPNRWRECPKCLALMKKLGIPPENASELQTRMTCRFAKFLADREREAVAWRNAIAWDYRHPEVMPPNLTLQVAHEWNDCQTRTSKGLGVIYCLKRDSYFSRPQDMTGEDPFQYYVCDYNAFGIILSEVLGQFPTQGLSKEQLKRFRGVECCSWGEMTWGWFDVNWKLWPRTFGTAEIGWLGPRRTDYDEFAARVSVLRKRLIMENVGAAPIVEYRPGRMIAGCGHDRKPLMLTGIDLPGLYGSPLGTVVDAVDPSTDRSGRTSHDALVRFVREGGTLFASVDQVNSGILPAELAGVSFSGAKRNCEEVVYDENGRRFVTRDRCDGVSPLWIGTPRSAVPFMKDMKGTVAIWLNDFGKGKVYTVTSAGFSPEKPGAARESRPILRALLGRVQEDMLPVRVTCAIPWNVSRTPDGAWRLHLDNTTSEDEALRVAVNLKELKGRQVSEVTTDGPKAGPSVDDGVFYVNVPALKARTFEIR